MRRPAPGAAAPPEPAPPAAAHDLRVGAFLAGKLRALDAELAQTLPRVRSESDAEAIHDMRVALRRLRTILRTARPVYGRFHADAVRRAFTEAQRATGILRDEEVLGETLGALAVRDPSFDRWRLRRAARERALRRGVIRELGGGELERGRELLGALTTLPVKPSKDVDVTRFALRCVQRAEKEVDRLSGPGVDDGVALHDLRIAYKHLRYALEIFAEALPPLVAERVKRAVQFQKRLGEIHDVDVAIDTVVRARALPEATRTRVLRALRKLRDEHVGKYLVLCAREAPPAAPPGARGAARVRPSAAPRSGRSRGASAPRPGRAGRRPPSPRA